MGSGFSGATIVCKRGIVTKTSLPGLAATRLSAAALKQENMRKVLTTARVPQVYDVAMNQDGCCVVTMEAVEGTLLESCMFDLNPVKIGSLLAEIVREISQICAPAHVLTEGAMLWGKLGDVVQGLLTIRGKCSGAFNAALDDFVYECELVDLPGEELEPTGCHGDLAFDNILVDNAYNVWLLDPLPQDFDSFYWDVAKILQSTWIDWPAIRDGHVRSVPMFTGVESVFMFKAGSISTRVESVFLQACPVEDSRLVLYLAVTLARIIPYAKAIDQKEALMRLATILLVNRRG